VIRIHRRWAIHWIEALQDSLEVVRSAGCFSKAGVGLVLQEIYLGKLGT
jgi:hypothetical protein